jgi:hypothetical protein
MKQQSKKCTTNNVSSLFDKGYQERFNWNKQRNSKAR